MPYLREGEKMQRCLCPTHSQIRSQKYYIRRKYYNPVERYICQTCCRMLAAMGYLEYRGVDGYHVINHLGLVMAVPALKEHAEELDNAVQR